MVVQSEERPTLVQVEDCPTTVLPVKKRPKMTNAGAFQRADNGDTGQIAANSGVAR